MMSPKEALLWPDLPPAYGKRNSSSGISAGVTLASASTSHQVTELVSRLTSEKKKNWLRLSEAQGNR